MKTKHFKHIIQAINNLNSRQNRELHKQLEQLAYKKHVSKFLETNFEDIHCPHCSCTKVHRWGKRNDMQRYRCISCKRTFNSLTGTPLAHLRRKGHWLDYSDCLKNGHSIRKAAVICDISIDTSFRWRHRFLRNSTTIKAQELHGIVEADETYFLRSEKGNKKLKRSPRRRGNNRKSTPKPKEQVCVFVGRDRNKNTFDSVMNVFNARNLYKIFNKHLAKDALLCTDTRSTYFDYARNNKIRHGFIDLSNGEYIKKDIVHIQNAFNYHNQFKHWIIYKFKGVATKYLNNYLGWYRAFDEFENQISNHTILLRAKSGGEYRVQPLTRTQPIIPLPP